MIYEIRDENGKLWAVADEENLEKVLGYFAKNISGDFVARPIKE